MGKKQSQEYKRNWLKENTDLAGANLDKEIVKEWKDKVKEDGITQAEFIRTALEEYNYIAQKVKEKII